MNPRIPVATLVEYQRIDLSFICFIHAMIKTTKYRIDHRIQEISRNKSFSPPPKFRVPSAMRYPQMGVSANGMKHKKTLCENAAIFDGSLLSL